MNDNNELDFDELVPNQEYLVKFVNGAKIIGTFVHKTIEIEDFREILEKTYPNKYTRETIVILPNEHKSDPLDYPQFYYEKLEFGRMDFKNKLYPLDKVFGNKEIQDMFYNSSTRYLLFKNININDEEKLNENITENDYAPYFKNGDCIWINDEYVNLYPK